jgi:nitrate reductase alpha subunit
VGDFKDGKNLFVAGQVVEETASVEKETYGLVKWWNLELKDRTPAWGEKESLIPAAQIVRVARAMVKAAPKVTVWMGPGLPCRRVTHGQPGLAQRLWFARHQRVARSLLYLIVSILCSIDPNQIDDLDWRR